MRSGALKIAFLYTVAGILWITLSDRLLLLLQRHFDLAFVLLLSSIKGIGYVLITGILLYQLIRLYTRRLANSEQQYRSYFEDNPIPMWIISRRTMLFSAVNDAAIRRFGYTREEFLRMSLLDLLPPEKINSTILAFREVSAGINELGVWPHLHRDGSFVSTHLSVQVPNAGPEQVLVVART